MTRRPFGLILDRVVPRTMDIPMADAEIVDRRFSVKNEVTGQPIGNRIAGTNSCHPDRSALAPQLERRI